MARYTVQNGDTLESIAKAKLGDETRWAELARLNGIADADAIQVGMTLRLPEEGVPPTLRRGSRGPTVKKLQLALIEAGRVVEPDGSYGAETVEAVRNFQAHSGLSPDGVAGPSTWRALLGMSQEAQSLPPKDRPSPALPKTYDAEGGETLRGIATKVYGEEAPAADILSRNRGVLPTGIGVDDPLPLSVRLRLPVPKVETTSGSGPRRARGWIVGALIAGFLLLRKPKEGQPSS